MSATDSAQQIRAKLDGFKMKLDDLEKASRTATPKESEDTRGAVKNMYGKVLDTLGRVAKLETSDVKKQEDLRKDINKAFTDLDKDYMKAQGKLQDK